MEILIIVLIAIIIHKIQYYIYLYNWHRNLSVDFKFKDEYIFEGEKTKIKETFINRKFLPLWWMRVQYAVSSYIEFEDEVNKSPNEKTNFKSEELSLLGYEKLEREKDIVGRRRGYYHINNMEILSSDVFVTDKFLLKSENTQHLYVFPTMVDEERFNVQFRKLLGEVVTRRQIVSDPYERKGIRDYNTYDTMKDINWGATARTGELKVNVYDYTSSQEVVIFLSVQKENAWVPDEVIEESIRIANTLYRYFYEMGIKVSLVSDAVDDNGNNMCFSYSTGDSFIAFNKLLAKMKIGEFNDNNISKYVKSEMCNENRNPLWVVITNSTRQSVKEVLIEAQNSRFDLRWIVVKREDMDVDVSGVKNTDVWDVRY